MEISFETLYLDTENDNSSWIRQLQNFYTDLRNLSPNTESFETLCKISSHLDADRCVGTSTNCVDKGPAKKNGVKAS